MVEPIAALLTSAPKEPLRRISEVTVVNDATSIVTDKAPVIGDSFSSKRKSVSPFANATYVFGIAAV